MTDDSGILSVDFLVGFTIFMVAFIWVATLVPNLFLGVKSHGVDFDAVAYRTGVILAEDPGATVPIVTTPWEFEKDSGKDNIERFGLAVSKDTPNILSEIKVKRFFCTTEVWPTGFSYPDDYRERVIFGDYPYRFNISLHEVGASDTRYVGDLLPTNYGYIRREVKIKHFSNATIDQTDVKAFRMNNSGPYANATSHDFSIEINTRKLLFGNVTDPVIKPNFDPAYDIDPRYEKIVITIEDLDKKPPQPGWAVNPTINLTRVAFTQSVPGYPLQSIPAGIVPHQNYTYDDGNLTPVNWPVNLTKNVTFVFEPGFFIAASEGGTIYMNLTFGVDVEDPNAPGVYKGMQYLNTTQTLPWDYNYYPVNVTQPVLRDAVLEVAVW